MRSLGIGNIGIAAALMAASFASVARRDDIVIRGGKKGPDHWDNPDDVSLGTSTADPVIEPKESRQVRRARERRIQKGQRP